ncbi:hypothetical protein [Candidatus Synchoanobacter obligatus]|uniref:Porin domain-containing protein n=1 Tax=Candidatus Synchoanobacter obligatus TaxID=2919597 RepID=A0ABT1L693_9GAMM|nr:hypothetical protein [Candidatus Synchoanobacter obligatus]MCP8352260.1 hypothetical protein [Candidatus Synchoanobacter obligatus]
MNKSLSLCASILLLSPLAGAAVTDGIKASLQVGTFVQSFGESGGSETNILGGTAKKPETGSVKTATYTLPTIGATVEKAFGEGKFSARIGAAVSKSDKVVLAQSVADADANDGETDIIGFSIEPKAKFFIDGLYNMGDFAAGIRFTVIRDELQMFYDDGADGDGLARGANRPDPDTTADFTYDDNRYVPGLVVKAGTQLGDSAIHAHVDVSYSMRDTDTIKNDADNTTIFHAATPMRYITGNIGLSYVPNNG